MNGEPEAACDFEKHGGDAAAGRGPGGEPVVSPWAAFLDGLDDRAQIPKVVVERDDHAWQDQPDQAGHEQQGGEGGPWDFESGGMHRRTNHRGAFLASRDASSSRNARLAGGQGGGTEGKGSRLEGTDFFVGRGRFWVPWAGAALGPGAEEAGEGF